MTPWPTRWAGFAHVNVQKSVSIDIDDAHAGTPRPFAVKIGLFGDILEREIAFVEVEFVGDEVACEKYIDEAVVVEVTKANATSVVEILECVSVDKNEIKKIKKSLEECNETS